MFQQIISFINNALYSYALIILLILAGIFFTIRSKFTQFSSLKEQLRVVGKRPTDKKAFLPFTH